MLVQLNRSIITCRNNLRSVCIEVNRPHNSFVTIKSLHRTIFIQRPDYYLLISRTIDIQFNTSYQETINCSSGDILIPVTHPVWLQKGLRTVGFDEIASKDRMVISSDPEYNFSFVKQRQRTAMEWSSLYVTRWNTMESCLNSLLLQINQCDGSIFVSCSQQISRSMLAVNRVYIHLQLLNSW